MWCVSGNPFPKVMMIVNLPEMFVDDGDVG
jgi:hypothetical protein